MTRHPVTLTFAALCLCLFTRCSANDAAARLLGVPPPSVQAQRHAELIEALPNAKILVLPVYFADRDQWVPARDIAEQLEPLAREVVLESNPPDIKRASVPPTSYRYWGRRIGQYRRWFAQNPPAADYIFVPEIYTHRVPRAQLFVLTSDGTLVHGSSVHWGGNPPADHADAANRIVNRFRNRGHMQRPRN